MITTSSASIFTSQFNTLTNTVFNSSALNASVVRALSDQTFGPLLQIALADYNNQYQLNVGGPMWSLLTTGQAVFNGNSVSLNTANAQTVVQSILTAALDTLWVSKGNGSQACSRLANDVQAAEAYDLTQGSGTLSTISLSSVYGQCAITPNASGTTFSGQWSSGTFSGVSSSSPTGLDTTATQITPAGQVTVTENNDVSPQVTMSGQVSDPQIIDNAAITLAAGSAATVNGSNNVISAAGSGATLTVASGTGDVVYLSQGSFNLSAPGAPVTSVIGTNDNVNLTANCGSALAVSGTNYTVNNDTGNVVFLVNPGTSAVTNGSGTVALYFSSTQLTDNSIGGSVVIQAGVTGEVINASGTTLSVAAGSSYTLLGSNDSCYLAGPGNLGGITAWGNNDIFYAPNPDGSKMAVTINVTGPLLKDSVGYLANGQEFEEARQNADGSGSFEYFSQSAGWSWQTSIINFNANGTAVSQETAEKDGTAFLTLFQQGSQTSNVTYAFGSLASANAALSSKNYAAAVGFISYLTGQSSGTRWGYNIQSLPDWRGSIDPLSGAGAIQWFDGLVSPFNVSTETASYFLGNNTAAANEGASTAQDLANTVVDPLVLNLQGHAVTTSNMANNGIKFDMTGTGQAERTGWITAGEGFLVDDPNGAPITSGSQFITDLHQLAQMSGGGSAQGLSPSQMASLRNADPTQYATNLAQMAALDNVGGGGKLTAAQATDLRVWVPAADARGGQLFTLGQLGIAEIDFNQTLLAKVDNGNQINNSFTFLYTNGSHGQGADVTFEVAPDSQTALDAQVNSMVTAMAGLPPAPAAGGLHILPPPPSAPPQHIAAALH